MAREQSGSTSVVPEIGSVWRPNHVVLVMALCNTYMAHTWLLNKIVSESIFPSMGVVDVRIS